MATFHFRSRALAARLLASAWLPALVASSCGATCGSSSSGAGAPISDAGSGSDVTSSGDTSTPQEAGPEAAPEAGPATVTVSPTAAKVLTCGTETFTGTPSGGTWLVNPSTSGSISASGVYSAPDKIPGSTVAVVGYVDVGVGSANATVTLGTAFPGTAIPVTLTLDDAGLSTEDPYSAWPFEKVFSSRGGTYAAVIEGDNLAVDVFTLAAAAMTKRGSYHTGYLAPGCATVAVDAGNPIIVYLVYFGGIGDSTANTGSTTRLAVSTDGGITFPHEYVIEDSYNGDPPINCPDVVSPSAGHVIVTGGQADPTAGTGWAATWVSDANGANIGPVGTEGVAYAPNQTFFAPTDTNMASATTCQPNGGSGEGSPRVFSNGSGTACIVYQWQGGCSVANDVVVQCSADSGSTWTPAAVVATPTNNTPPSAAVSPDGKHIAVVYSQQVAANGNFETFVAFSQNGGVTWGAPVQYPTASWTNLGASGTSRPTIGWENDSVLWLAESGLQQPDFLLVDKTCDFGQSWSGAINAGTYESGGILRLSTSIMAAVGVNSINDSAGSSLALLPLTQ